MAKKAAEVKEDEVDVDKEPELEVKVEGETTPEPVQEPEKKETKPEGDEDVAALKQQLSDLRSAQELSRQQAQEAERRAQEAAAQLHALRQTAEQSQYDSIVTAMGSAQMEVESAKRDFALANASQDYVAATDAMERLAAAKARVISLEGGKETYEQRRQQMPDPIDSNQNLTVEERSWLKQHPDALSDARKNAKLNAAYFDAMDMGLQRGTRDYFNFIEEQMGYKPKQEVQREPEPQESPAMVAAPPSRTVPSGRGGSNTRYTITKDEAEIAALSGITPAEYVKQKLLMEEAKKKGQIQ